MKTPNETKGEQITHDGVPGIIYNGVPDWVYEEEVLGTGSALWFSPNGDRIAFVRFNDTQVKEFSYTIYGTPGDLKNQYPETVTIRYPKAGETNPTVSLIVADLTGVRDLKTVLNLDHDNILFHVTWATNDYVVAVLMNRIQNKGKLLKCSFDDCYVS